MYVTQSLHRALQQHPQRIAIRDRDLTLNFVQLAERVARLAGALQALGMSPGDRVAILALNAGRYLEAELAILWGGGAVNPCNIRWSPAEIIYSLNDSTSTILFVDNAFAAHAGRIRSECASLRHLIHVDDGAAPADTHSYEELIAGTDPVADARRQGDDLAGVFYTGGTTGFPKGVMLSQRNLLTSALSILAEGIATPGGTYLHAAPMFHLADMAMSLMHQLAGNTHAFIPAFDAAAVLAAIETHRVTDVLLVPTMIQMLLDHPGADARLAAGPLRRIIYGASPIAEALLERAMRATPNIEFVQAYGMTELGPLATINPACNHTEEARRAGWHRAAGRASFCTEVKIVDAEGRECPRGTVGEVVVRGENRMLGYWNRPEQTAAAIRDGWMHTGDAACMDEHGLIYIVDRIKDMIVSGGENVYSAEVESAIVQHSAVAACAVIGVPSAEWGETVHAVVVPRPGAQVTQAEIVAHCRSLIAGYKCPRSVEFRDALPLSGAGKVLKMELRKPFWDDNQRRFG